MGVYFFIVKRPIAYKIYYYYQQRFLTKIPQNILHVSLFRKINVLKHTVWEINTFLMSQRSAIPARYISEISLQHPSYSFSLHSPRPPCGCLVLVPSQM